MIISTLLTVTEFIGHFHPVLVHLPVGVLLLAVLFHFLSFKTKYEWLKPAVKLSLFIGTLSAIASCITGYLLSSSGEYNEALVSKHQWFAIGLSAVALVAYYFYDKKLKLVKYLTPLIGLLIIITGHLGGSLTHGEDYLTNSFSSKQNADNIISKPIANVQEAVVYTDIVQPILQAKCYSCHSATKQKAALRLDEPDYILKGSENGKVIIAGNTGESEMIQRLLLTADDDDHMPPKAKPQLTKEQIELLSWWVNSGADFHKKVAETEQPEKIKPYLTSLQTGGKKLMPTESEIPEKPIEKAPDSVIKKLMEMDVAVSKVAQNSNYLTVSFITITKVTPRHLQLLKLLNRQIVYLKFTNTNINDSNIAVVDNFSALTRLYLDKTTITDKGLVHLKNLEQLQYLNLSGTGVTANGLTTLGGLKKLKKLFLYKTAISAEGFSAAKQNLPNTIIDTGGYKVEFIATDTMLAKPKPDKN